MFAFHTTEIGLILNIPYGPLSMPGVIPDPRARNHEHFRQRFKKTENKPKQYLVWSELIPTLSATAPVPSDPQICFLYKVPHLQTRESAPRAEDMCWVTPVTAAVEPKSSWLQQLPSDPMPRICGCVARVGKVRKFCVSFIPFHPHLSSVPHLQCVSDL